MDETTWPDALPPYEELRAAWGRDAAVWKSRSPDTLPFTVPDVDLIVRDGRARHPQVSVLSNGMPAALSDYTTTRSINGSNVAGFVDPTAVHRLLAGGGSLHLTDLQSVHDGVGALCDTLTDRVGRPFSAMAFLSPPGRSAFVLHRDPLHVVVLQTSGTKTWELHRPVAGPDHGPLPTNSLAAPDRYVTLEAGDALYVPPGWPHRATSSDRWSLHLSIVTSPLRVRQVLGPVLGHVLNTLTDEVPAGWCNAVEDGADILRAASGTVADRLASTDWETVLRDAATRPAGMARSLVGLVEAPYADSTSEKLATSN